MGLRDRFSTDTDLEIEGVWCDYGEGVRVQVGRAGGANVDYLKATEDLYRKHKTLIDMEAMPAALANQLMLEVFARTIVKEWVGVTQDDLFQNGILEEAPCTTENAVIFLKEFDVIHKDIKKISDGSSAYRKKVDEDIAKN